MKNIKKKYNIAIKILDQLENIKMFFIHIMECLCLRIITTTTTEKETQIQYEKILYCFSWNSWKNFLIYRKNLNK